MKDLTFLNANIQLGEYSEASNLVTEATANKIEEFSAKGYTIIVGNNPDLQNASKYQNCDVVRISKVNSRFHGKCIRTIFAVKPR